MFGNPLQGGPEYLMDRDVVYVNLNYRVGLIGEKNINYDSLIIKQNKY